MALRILLRLIPPAGVDAVVAAEHPVIRGQQHVVHSLVAGGDEIALKGLGGIEVEGEHHIALAVDQHLVGLMDLQQLRVLGQDMFLLQQSNHSLVKLVELAVTKGIVIHQDLVNLYLSGYFLF